MQKIQNICSIIHNNESFSRKRSCRETRKTAFKCWFESGFCFL